VSVHFALPFMLGPDGQFAVVDQDSEADIEACIRAILLSRIGYRDDRPEFGIDDPTFRQGGVHLEALQATLATFEPRADRLLSRDPAQLQGLVDRITVAKPDTTT
jgi:phage baseplate assembly protein W